MKANTSRVLEEEREAAEALELVWWEWNGLYCGLSMLSYDFSLELVEKCALHHVHSCFTRGRNGLRSCRRIIVMKSHDCRRLGGRA